MDPCKSRFPQVIDNEFLLRKIKENYKTKGERGRLALMEKISFDKVDDIVLEYSNILQLDHLWMLSNLKRLTVNNNFIEEIKNLESLVQLEYLDLSFNNIKIIEGVDSLVNLKILSLFSNKISTINNLDNLCNLEIFSIGRNQITDKSNVLYLRNLDNLKSLNMEENPCAEEENFRLYIACFLPNLIFYHYRRITPLEKEVGMEIYSLENRLLLSKEITSKAKKEEEIKRQKDVELHSQAFVEHLDSDQLFEALFQNDIEGRFFININEEVKNLAAVFKNNFVRECLTIFYIGQEHYNRRGTEIDQYNSGILKVTLELQKKSVENTKTFLKIKDEIFSKINKLQDDFYCGVTSPDDYFEGVESLIKEYKSILQGTWKELMQWEMALYDQISDINELFERTLTEMINKFVEEIQGTFVEIRTLTIEYAENVADAMRKYQLSLPEYETNEEFELIREKEALSNFLAASRDAHLLVIETREDTVIMKAKNWLLNHVSSIQSSSIGRNRDAIKEINNFIEVQMKELQDLTFDFGGLNSMIGP